MEEKPVKKALSAVLAILLTLGLLVTFTACKKDPVPPTEPETSEESITEPVTVDAAATTDEEPTSEPEPTTEEPTTEEPTTVPTDPYAPPENLGSLGKADQLAYFNKVANRVRTEKPGFKYDYLEQLGRMDFTGAVSLVSGIIDSLKKKLMPGDWEYKTINKGTDNKGKFLSENANASDLKSGDVTTISATKSGGNWVIRVNLVQETNPAKGTGSAHSRVMPIASRQDVLNSITDINDAISADVNDTTLRYHSGYATLTVNEKGQVIGGEFSFQVDAQANKVKISVLTTNITAPQSTVKKYHDFVW